MKNTFVHSIGVLILLWLVCPVVGWSQCSSNNDVTPANATFKSGSAGGYIYLPGRSVTLTPSPLPSGYLWMMTYQWRKGNSQVGTAWTYTATSSGAYEIRAMYETGGGGGGGPLPFSTKSSGVSQLAMQWYEHGCITLHAHSHSVSISGTAPSAVLQYTTNVSSASVPTVKWYRGNTLVATKTGSGRFTYTATEPGSYHAKAVHQLTNSQSTHEVATSAVTVNPPPLPCMYMSAGPTPSVPGINNTINSRLGESNSLCLFSPNAYGDYRWTKVGGGAGVVSTSTYHSAKVNQPGTYKLEGADPETGTWSTIGQIELQGFTQNLTETGTSPFKTFTYSENTNINPTIIWKLNGNTIPNQNGSQFTMIGFGRYECHATYSSNGSTYTHVFTKDYSYTDNFSVSGNFPDKTLTYTFTAAGSTPVSPTYKWYKNNTLTGFTSNTVTVSEPGIWKVVATFAQGTQSVSYEKMITIYPSQDLPCLQVISGPGDLSIPGIPTIIRVNKGGDCNYPDTELFGLDQNGDGFIQEFEASHFFANEPGQTPATRLSSSLFFDDYQIGPGSYTLSAEAARPQAGGEPVPHPIASYQLSAITASLVADVLQSEMIPPGSTLSIATNGAHYIHQVKWFLNNEEMSEYQNKHNLTAFNYGYWHAEITFRHEQTQSDPVVTNTINIGYSPCISILNNVTVAIDGMFIELGVVTNPDICSSQPVSFNGTGFDYHMSRPDNYRAMILPKPDNTFSVAMKAMEGNYNLIAIPHEDAAPVRIGNFYLPPLNLWIYANGHKTDDFDFVDTGTKLTVRANIEPIEVKWFRNGELHSTSFSVSNSQPGIYHALVKFQQGEQEASVKSNAVVVGPPGIIGNVSIIAGPHIAIPTMYSRLAYWCEGNCNQYLWAGLNSTANNLPDSQHPGFKTAEAYATGHYFVLNNDKDKVGEISLDKYELSFLVNNNPPGGTATPEDALYVYNPQFAGTPITVSFQTNAALYIDSVAWYKNDLLLNAANQVSINQPGDYSLKITYKASDQEVVLEHPFKVRSYALLMFDPDDDKHPVDANNLLLGDTRTLLARENTYYSDFPQKPDPISVHKWYKDGVEINAGNQPHPMKLVVTEPGTYKAELNYQGGKRLFTNDVTVDNRILINQVTTYSSKVSGLTADTDIMQASEDKVSKSVNYLDGFGRPLQTVNVKASSNNKDVATVHHYDGFGRELKKYLPFERNTSDGRLLFFNPETPQNALKAFYSNPQDEIADTAIPYTESLFEASPVNRLLREASPGTSVQSNNVRTFEYGANTSGEVTKWSMNSNGQPVVSGTYASGELSKSKVIDENGNVSIEYKDKLEQLILTRKVNEDNGVTQYIDTYFVYTPLGQLIFVLPPNIHSVN